MDKLATKCRIENKEINTGIKADSLMERLFLMKIGGRKISKILEMIEKRNKAWESVKAFLESKRDKDGLISEEDALVYVENRQKVT